MSEFDEYYKKYNKMFDSTFSITGGNRDYYLVQKAEMVEKLLTKSNSVVLDFGCGDGLSTQKMIEKMPLASFYGVEVSEQGVEIAKKSKIRGNFSCYNGAELPYTDNFFDTVVVSCVFHHIRKEEFPIIFREISRVLKPEGYLIVFEHNSLSLVTRILINDCEIDKNIEFVTPRALKKCCINANLIPNSVHYYNIFPNYAVFKHTGFIERLLSKFPVGAQYCFIAKKEL